MPRGGDNIGKHVDVVTGTYSGCKGQIVDETPKMFYVELAGHNDTKRVLRSSVIVINNRPLCGIEVTRNATNAVVVDIMSVGMLADQIAALKTEISRLSNEVSTWQRLSRGSWWHLTERQDQIQPNINRYHADVEDCSSAKVRRLEQLMTWQGDAIKNALINIQQNTDQVLDFTEIAIDVFGNSDGHNDKHGDKDSSNDSISGGKL
jgi:hypothetical protein